MSTQINTADLNKRLGSLDFMRGFIMFLLTLEATGLYGLLEKNAENTFWAPFVEQLHHHQWNGLRFWDLIQPGFMFIAGTAMALSINKMKEKGVSKNSMLLKTLKRSGWLFFWGVLIYAVHEDGLAFELWNVLTQLSFTLLIAFFIFEWSVLAQIFSCLFLLILTEFLFRFTNIEGYDQPFVKQHNFGSYIDMLLMHKTSRGGWLAFNCIPTSVHTIAGAIIGKVLLGKEEQITKLKKIFMWAFPLLVAGYGMDLLHITPIIKRISTSSFTIVSLGWCMIALGVCYYLVDIKGSLKKILFINVLGMNSIFIYLFFEIPGGKFLNDYINQIFMGIGQITFISSLILSIVSCITIFLIEWYLCYFLYKKKIFFRI